MGVLGHDCCFGCGGAPLPTEKYLYSCTSGALLCVPCHDSELVQLNISLLSQRSDHAACLNQLDHSMTRKGCYTPRELATATGFSICISCR